jgi:hypothetical protein
VEITESGRQRVCSQKFAAEFREFTGTLIDVHEDRRIHSILCYVAAALTGKPIPISESEQSEFNAFLSTEEHLSEATAVANKIFQDERDELESKPLEITDAGRQYVDSLEFALELLNTTKDLSKFGLAEKLGVAHIVAMIGWGLTGHDIANPPSEIESQKLATFVETHVEEINTASRKVLQAAAEYDGEMVQ